jgi:aspartate carbamoyltransferase catalytic subunit
MVRRMKTQQAALRGAMKQLGLTREGLANRLGVKRRALDTWLLPDASRESRTMPGVVAKLLADLPEAAGEESSGGARDSTGLRQRITRPGKPHLLSVAQFERESVSGLLRVAESMEPIARRRKTTRALEGAVLGNLFFEPSTRTRVSFASAFARLGGTVCDTTGFTFSSMAKGESIHDTSRVMSGYVDALVVRHPDKGSVAEFARVTRVPVINGGDGAGEHPTQALVDLYTIEKEFARRAKRLDGAHVAFVGDLKYGRTVHSLLRLLSLYKNLTFSLVAPRSLEMPAALVDLAARAGHRVRQQSSLDKGPKKIDVLYATRIQKERMTGEALEAYPPDFRIDRRRVNAFCEADTVIMHPLPRDSTPGANDLAVDLDGDPRLAIFRQTDNGVAVRMAIFAVLLGVERHVAKTMRDALWLTPDRIGPGDTVPYRLA